MSDLDILTKIPELNYSENAPEINVEEFEKVVRSRRSVRVYCAEKIPDEIVHKCLDIALLAPNSSNLQPWEFYRIKTPEHKKEVARICMNQPAARTAAELIVCVARRDTWQKHAKQMVQMFDESETKAPASAYMYYKKIVYLANSVGPFGVLAPFKKAAIFLKRLGGVVPGGNATVADMRVWMHKSTALACENLMLAFRAYGYDSCPMEGFDSAKLSKFLNLPCSAEVCMVISAGKRADNGVYGPQIRFPREQFIKEI
jgi:nitroreductase